MGRMRDGMVKPGRPEAQVGSHVAGHNTGTLGVVIVGGTDAGPTRRTPARPCRRPRSWHVKALIARYPTIKKVTGHNRNAAKACLSFDVRRDDLGKLV